MDRKKLLFIQQFISLLDEYHYEVFIQDLKLNNAQLSIRLCSVIRNRLPEFHSISELNKAIYGDGKSSKGALNQLAFHTIKLSKVLATNYPNYLAPVLTVLERKLNEGKALADVVKYVNDVIDVSVKVGDFVTSSKASSFMIQHNRRLKVEYVQYLDLYKEAINNHDIVHRLYMYKIQPPQSETLLDDAMETCCSFFEHSHPAIRIFSRYVFLVLQYRKYLISFETKPVIDIISEFEILLKAHPYICFPFMLDIEGSIMFKKLNSPYTIQNSVHQSKEYIALSQRYSQLQYAKAYEIGQQTALMTTQLTMLLTKYHTQIFKKNYKEIITKEDGILINALLDTCAEIFNEHKYIKEDEYRKLAVCKSALLILSGGNNIDIGILEFESFLITYQQVNLKQTTGTIYFFLMIGYFALRKYEACIELYRRYAKVSKGKGIFKGNDWKIRMFYYFAQWQKKQSPQYAFKVKELLKNYEIIPQAAHELLAFCKMSLDGIEHSSD